MTTFIMRGRYSTETVKQISAKRTTKAVGIIKQCGGKLIGAYATMGETDIVAIMEFPGVNEAMKASVALNKALGISFSTVPALRMEDFDKLVGGKAQGLLDLAVRFSLSAAPAEATECCRNSPPEMVKKWQSILDELKKDGTFEKIYKSYLPGADMNDLLKKQEKE